MTLDDARLKVCLAFLDGSAEMNRQMEDDLPAAGENAELLEGSARAIRELISRRREART